MPTPPTSQTLGFRVPYRKIIHTVRKETHDERKKETISGEITIKTNIYVTPLVQTPTPSKLAITLLASNREVTGSNFCQDTDCRDRGFSWFS
jgi:hypothetical protein